MGEIFRREAAERPEPFTGERLTACIGGQVQIEHYHRYLFARSLVTGMDVLDVASGEGYGSALLAQVARRVIAVDNSGATARAAARNFPRPNLHFVHGDARALPFADACVDTVVSFETIEHLDRQADFVREVRRVLRPDGSYIVSTPDRDVYSPIGMPVNPFHVRELTEAEFVALLQASFRHVRIIRQRPLIGSALLGDTASAAAPLVFERRNDTHFEACSGLPRAPYLLALASHREPPPLPPCVYVDRSDLDTDMRERLATTERLRRIEQELAEARERGQRMAQTLADSRRALAASELRSEALQRRHDLLQGSLRTFLRGYLPLLRRHLFARRP
jgi:SAM-dependent methyltransferase